MTNKKKKKKRTGKNTVYPHNENYRMAIRARIIANVIEKRNASLRVFFVFVL